MDLSNAILEVVNDRETEAKLRNERDYRGTTLHHITTTLVVKQPTLVNTISDISEHISKVTFEIHKLWEAGKLTILVHTSGCNYYSTMSHDDFAKAFYDA